MSWKMEVLVSGEWCDNAVRFETRAEAEQAGKDLLARWFVPTDSRAMLSSDPVNYKLVDGVQRPTGERTTT